MMMFLLRGRVSRGCVLHPRGPASPCGARVFPLVLNAFGVGFGLLPPQKILWQYHMLSSLLISLNLN